MGGPRAPILQSRLSVAMTARLAASKETVRDPRCTLQVSSAETSRNGRCVTLVSWACIVVLCFVSSSDPASCTVAVRASMPHAVRCAFEIGLGNPELGSRHDLRAGPTAGAGQSRSGSGAVRAGAMLLLLKSTDARASQGRSLGSRRESEARAPECLQRLTKFPYDATCRDAPTLRG